MTPILLVAFGAMSPSARTVYAALEARVRAAHPGRPLRWAYTATTLVARLRAKGEVVATLDEALEALAQEGFQGAALASLHLVPGEKHQEVVEAHAHGLRLAVGDPLLTDAASIEQAANQLLETAPPERPLLVVAHGHAHDDRFNTALRGLKAELAQRRPGSHLALLEGDDDEAGLEAFRHEARRLGRVHVQPFLLVAGDHVQNDILGEDPDSFRSRLGVADFTCGEPLGAQTWVQDAFLARLEAALCRLEHA